MLKKIICMVSCIVCAGGSALAYDMDRVQIHGFVSQGYLKSDQYDYLNANTEDGTFEFNEFGLNFTTSPTDTLRVGLQLLARDLGKNGNDAVSIDWAFGDYRHRNWLGVRAGKMKRAFGLYNQIRDIDAAHLGVFLPLSVYDESFKDYQSSIIGIGGYGTLPGGFEYQVQYGTFDYSEVDPDDDGYALHLAWNTPLDGLRLVGSLNQISWAQEIAGVGSLEFDLDMPLVGFEYSWGELTCAAEYLQLNLDMSGQESRTSEFYYGLLGYRFTEWFEVASSYAVLYQDKDDKEGNNYAQQGKPKALAWRKDLAISTRFDVTDSWIVKIEGHWMNGLYGVSNYGENPDENGFLAAAKVTFSF